MGLFSIIIATRNRPRLFAEALASVLVQKGDSNEIIVVNDGSDDAHLGEYQDALNATRDQLSSIPCRSGRTATAKVMH
ncbi:hypothetical protein BI364_11630 [Acidihalobacter yilgarnensis]|uniref:Glycosyltransferase 2-like domain-containing protein n=1 Tax=Acidihalobacter yilgarnensis TaxID=2819280 RepID=A0A1D8IPZ2_9GAMM|nr:hypothetical protein BI364_11630 [Acidihalobacter yilgarnensis]